jgi:hypothetical protein
MLRLASDLRRADSAATGLHVRIELDRVLLWSNPNIKEAGKLSVSVFVSHSPFLQLSKR